MEIQPIPETLQVMGERVEDWVGTTNFTLSYYLDDSSMQNIELENHWTRFLEYVEDHEVSELHVVLGIEEDYVILSDSHSEHRGSVSSSVIDLESGSQISQAESMPELESQQIPEDQTPNPRQPALAASQPRVRLISSGSTRPRTEIKARQRYEYSWTVSLTDVDPTVTISAVCDDINLDIQGHALYRGSTVTVTVIAPACPGEYLFSIYLLADQVRLTGDLLPLQMTVFVVCERCDGRYSHPVYRCKSCILMPLCVNCVFRCIRARHATEKLFQMRSPLRIDPPPFGRSEDVHQGPSVDSQHVPPPLIRPEYVYPGPPVGSQHVPSGPPLASPEDIHRGPPVGSQHVPPPLARPGYVHLEPPALPPMALQGQAPLYPPLPPSVSCTTCSQPIEDYPLFACSYCVSFFLCLSCEVTDTHRHNLHKVKISAQLRAVAELNSRHELAERLNWYIPKVSFLDHLRRTEAGSFRCSEIVEKGWRIEIVVNGDQLIGEPRLVCCSPSIEMRASWLGDAIAYPSFDLMAELRMPSQCGEYFVEFKVVDDGGELHLEQPLVFFATVVENFTAIDRIMKLDVTYRQAKIALHRKHYDEDGAILSLMP